MTVHNALRPTIVSLLTAATWWLGVGCTSVDTSPAPLPSQLEWATLLALDDHPDGTSSVRIMNPWHPNDVLVEYLLVPQAANDPRLQADEAPQGENTIQIEARQRSLGPTTGKIDTIHTPLRHLTIGASCHVYLMLELGSFDNVAAVCDVDYTDLPSVHERLADGRLRDAGSAITPNIEVLFDVGTDAVWLSPFENAGFGQLAILNAPIIYCADYMEPHPLARAEWMRFYGRLVGRGREADSLFAVVRDNYCRATTSDTRGGPKILVDLPVSSTWYVPGGRSTMGRLYQDAGFTYPWADDVHAGSLALSPEAVLDRAMDCDIWLFKYYDTATDIWSIDDLKARHDAFAAIGAVRSGALYGCNTAHSRYFDQTPFRPDMLLESLRRVAAGEQLSDSVDYFLPLASR